MENNNDDIQAIWWIIGVLIVGGIGAYFLVFNKGGNTAKNIPTKIDVTEPSNVPKETVPNGDILPDNKKTMDDKNTITTKDGLKITTIKEGSGDVAENGKTVTVHYTGTFADGKKFDSSVDRGQPFSFPLGAGRVIKGWDEGVLGMKVGEKRKLIIPSDLAYGPNDYASIPGGSTLYFDVELLGVK